MQQMCPEYYRGCKIRGSGCTQGAARECSVHQDAEQIPQMLRLMWKSLAEHGYFLYDDPGLAALWGPNGLIHREQAREGMIFTSNLLHPAYLQEILSVIDRMVESYFLSRKRALFVKTLCTYLKAKHDGAGA